MRVYVCSPLRGDYAANIQGAIQHCRAIALYGEIPVAPHIYCTQFLDDTVEDERRLGMDIGMKLLEMCDCVLVFGERISEGMQQEIDMAVKLDIPVRYVQG